MRPKNLIAVYAGMYVDCIDLQLTLAGNGIGVEVEMEVPSDFGADAHVCVDRADVERAIPIVEHFKRQKPGVRPN